MKDAASRAANVAGWIVIAGMIGVAAVMAAVLGFMGLIILGAATWLICLQAGLDQDVPAWGRDVFRSRLEEHASPEQRAAALEERRATVSPLRFYGRCGAALFAFGVTGFVLQQLGFAVHLR